MPLLLKRPTSVIKAIPRVLRAKASDILLIAIVGNLLVLAGFLVQQGYYRLPASFFLNYKTVVVNAGKAVEPHQPIPLEVCRHKRGDIKIEAYRRFYNLPENPNLTTAEKKKQGRLIKGVELKGPLEENECAQLTITLQQLDHAPGEYYFSQDVYFTVGGQRKFVSYQSPIYVVSELSDPDDIRKQIEFYKQRIKDLEKRLQAAGVKFTPTFAQTVSTNPTPLVANTSKTTEPTTSAPPETPQQDSLTNNPATRFVNRIIIEPINNIL